MMFPLNHGVMAAGGAIGSFGFDGDLTIPANAVFTLTNGSRSASLDANTDVDEYIGVVPSRSSGKYYLEYTITPYNTITSGVVFALPTFSGGADNAATDAISFRSQQIFAYGTYLGTNGFSGADGASVIGIAFDFDNLTATYYRDGVAGGNVVSLTAGTYTPYYNANSSTTQICTVRAASEIEYLPSGFTAWAEAGS